MSNYPGWKDGDVLVFDVPNDDDDGTGGPGRYRRWEVGIIWFASDALSHDEVETLIDVKSGKPKPGMFATATRLATKHPGKSMVLRKSNLHALSKASQYVTLLGHTGAWDAAPMQLASKEKAAAQKKPAATKVARGKGKGDK